MTRDISMTSQPSVPWTLHPTLARDAIRVGDLPLSQLLISNDANYPWLLLVPRRPDVCELIDLDISDQLQLTAEIRSVAGALKDATGCDKLNIAALGNVVPQLHVHVIARRRSDAAWPRPVWGVVPPRPYGQPELDDFTAAIRQRIWRR